MDDFLLDYEFEDYKEILKKMKRVLQLPYDYEFDEEFVNRVKNNTDKRQAEIEEYRRKIIEKQNRNRKVIASRPPGVPNKKKKKEETYSPVSEENIKKAIEYSKILYAKARFAYDLVEEYLKKYNVSEKTFRFRAGVSRNDIYKLKNETAKLGKVKFFQIAIGIGLDIPDAEALLSCAGYAFDLNERLDTLICGCLAMGIHDIIHVNDVLIRENFPEEKLLKNLYSL